MSNVVVLLDQTNTTALSGGDKELLTLARTLGEPVAVVLGDPGSITDQLGAYGVASVLAAKQPEIASYLVAPAAEALAAAVGHAQASVVLTSNTSFSKDVAGRVSVLLDAGVISDVVSLTSELVAEKSELAGSYTVHAQVATPVGIYTVKANAIEAAEADAPVQAEVQDLLVEFSQAATAAQITGRDAKAVSGRPALNTARIVVAGGRGTDGDFSAIEAMADALGGAVGASRAATDAGWIDHSAQVGQTGTTVSPQLYISAGISGAIQQKAGMQTAKVIVAINKDQDSPVFEIADLGIVGDLFDVLPQAVEEIQRRRG